jgi:NitT/TauT family transport system permease protein
MGLAAAAPPAAALVWQRRMTHAGILVVLLSAWETGVAVGWLDPLFFPRPSQILTSFGRIYVTQGNIWYHLAVSMGLVLAGFAAGSVLGVGLGAVVGMNATVRRFLQPYIIVLEATPRIAVAPLIIAAVGFGAQSKIGIIMLVCFFAPFINTLSGVIQTDRDRLELMRSLGASRWQVLTRLVLPDAVPLIMAGERLALTASLSGVLVAEFIQRDQGIGSLILTYTRNLNMASAFACILTLTLIGFLIFKGMEWVDNHVSYWKSEAGLRRVAARRQAAWARMQGAVHV